MLVAAVEADVFDKPVHPESWLLVLEYEGPDLRGGRSAVHWFEAWFMP